MSTATLLNRYQLAARAEGDSQDTIDHVSLAVTLFSRYRGGIADVTEVTGDDLRHFILYLKDRPRWAGTPHEKKEKLSGTTVNTYTRGVKMFWAWLAREKIIGENPMPAVRSPSLPKRLPKIITQDQLKAVFEAAAGNPRETALLMVLLDTGMTLSEISGLPERDVDVKNGTIKVYREKTKKERQVFISPATAAVIEKYRFSRPEPAAEPMLFLTDRGFPLRAARIQRILAIIGSRAGISTRLSPHKLRHTFATCSLKYGSNMEYLRLLLGHSDIRTTSNFYLHATSEDLARAHQHFSPVVNLGLHPKRGGAEKPRRKQEGDIAGAGPGGTVIIVQNQSPWPHPADGIQPVIYSNKPEAEKPNKRRAA